MNSLAHIIERRQQLLSKSGNQRREFAHHCQCLKKPLSTVDKGIRFIRFFQRHRVLTFFLTTLIVSRFSLPSLVTRVKTLWQLAYPLIEKLRKNNS